MPQTRPTFQSPFDQYSDRVGQPFEVVRAITEPGEVDYECLPMFVIRFEDGEEIQAWPDEVYDDENPENLRYILGLLPADHPKVKK